MSAVLDINAADNTFFGAELDKKILFDYTDIN